MRKLIMFSVALLVALFLFSNESQAFFRRSVFVQQQFVGVPACGFSTGFGFASSSRAFSTGFSSSFSIAGNGFQTGIGVVPLNAGLFNLNTGAGQININSNNGNINRAAVMRMRLR